MRHTMADIYDERVISRASWTYRTFEAGCVVVGIGAMMLRTEPDLPAGWGGICLAIDIFVLLVFALDWLVRLWVIPLQHMAMGPADARKEWISSRSSIIGILSLRRWQSWRLSIRPRPARRFCRCCGSSDLPITPRVSTCLSPSSLANSRRSPGCCSFSSAYC